MRRFFPVLFILLLFTTAAFATVTVSSPASGSTVTSPVHYVATASASTCSKGVASMGIYVNSKLVYVVQKNALNTELTIAKGAQHTVVEEWDKCGKATYTTVNITVVATLKPTVTITANPTSIKPGSSTKLTVTATNATKVTASGTNGKSYTFATTGGTASVSPTSTTTYTATATGSGGTTTAKVTVAVSATPAPTVSIKASPSSIVTGGSSTLTVSATNATQVTIVGSDSSKYTLKTAEGNQVVTPASTTTYTATATGAGGATATAQTIVTVGPKALTSVSVSPSPGSFAMGTTQQFTATANYSDKSTANITSTATWSVANTAVATIGSSGLATSVASGSTTVTASQNGVAGNAQFTVTIAPGTAVNVPTWHFDTYRSGLNANETSLTTSNVSSQTFGKLFSYLVDGYPYAQPLLVSNVTINGATHNVLYVATQYNSVYAFDADNYGTGAPLWKVSVMKSGETPDTGGPILPFEGITSTPVIDLNTNTMYVVSKQHSSSGNFFRLSALDITSGAQKFGGPATINASVPATNSAAVNGVQTLTTSCLQRSALLEAYGNVYFGFGSCHTGWLLGYDVKKLTQTGVFNASTILNGEGEWASAGGVWMGGGGPASNGDGNVYITTGNGPWDGQTAWSDSILKLDPTTLAVEDYFTPQMFQYMDCADGDLASGGLLLIPGTTQALAGGKLSYMYLVDTTNLGHEQAGDAGALWTGSFESDLIAQKQKGCLDANGTTYNIQNNEYEIYGTPAYFNNSVYLGITALQTGIPAGLRQFTYSGNSLTPATYTADGTQEEIRGTTPFVSANGTSDGVLWMLDQGLPLQSTASGAPTHATLRAFDPTNLSDQLYNSSTNPADVPGYGIKFTSPIVANGKVYIPTGHDPTSASHPQGEIDVYGLN